MKTTVHKLALGMAALLGLFSCDEKHEGELINDKEAKINAFQANGIDGIIDEEKIALLEQNAPAHRPAAQRMARRPAPGRRHAGAPP